jgi:hypothetical protein
LSVEKAVCGNNEGGKKMTKRLISLVTVLVVLSSMVMGQTSGKISGTVYDASQNAPLGFTNVVIQGTSLGAVSDEQGRYVILDVPPGVYKVICTYIGYQTLEVEGLTVISGLTTNQDFQMNAEDVVGEVVTVVADKPLINMNATNTTRVVDAALIENMAVRGVENVVALQTGVVQADGEIHIRGSRYQDVAYYVDGVYMNDAFDMRNTSTMSNAAMEEMQLQTGGFSAQYGNANGGVVSTSTRTGGESMNIDFEFVQGLGASGDGTEDKLYSLGYRLYNVNFGGALGSKIRYFVNYEGRTTDDPRPSSSPHYSMDRTELDIDWTKMSFSDSTGEMLINGDLFVGGTRVDTISDVLAASLGSKLETLLGAHFGDAYDEIDAISVTNTSEDNRWIVNGYDNFQTLYGARRNNGSDRSTLTGNVMFDLKPFKIKVGGTINNITSYGYSTLWANSLLNTDYNRRAESSQTSFYTNLTWILSTKSYLKAKFSMFNYEEAFGDDVHWDDVEAYGDPTLDRNKYLSNEGLNPLSVAQLANFYSYGRVWDDYSYQNTSYTGITVDYLNQIGFHELTAGFEYRGNTIKYYRVGQPVELASFLEDGMTEEERYIVYRNAYTENMGYDLYGNDDENGNSYQEPGKPTIFGGYINDKLEMKDLVINLGLRYEYFNANTEAPADWNDISMTAGRIDREASGFAPVEADVQINPRLGFSFPVTDKTKFHAQYGKFSQHPVLSNLYLSDVVFAANFTSGNYTISPNADLRTEKTTQYEVGFSQVLGANVALDVTGFYKEIRDYTLVTNRFNAELDGAEFVWAQYLNGDYGVVKGMSFGLGMNRTKGLMANLSYTASWAEGTGSDPLSNYYIAWQSDQGAAGFPSLINPLDYDQRHTGSLLLDYRLGKSAGMLEGSGVNMVYTFGSGTAYTPASIESALYGRGEIYPSAPINSGYTPWNTNLDIRFDTGLEFGNIGMTVFLLIQNALAVENVNTVYSGTGSASTDGWLYTDPGKAWLSGNEDAADYYLAQIRDPSNWEKPRSVQLGVKMNLLSGENN